MKKINIQTKTIGLIIGSLSAISILLFADLDPQKPEITATLAVAVLMAIWWITEAVPVAVTALLPVVLFPVLGVMNGKAVSSEYFNSIIFLFIGGFLVALAMEKYNLHKRIALKILSFTGSGYGKILFGFMFSTAFLSMWMSNTATAMMMVPVAMSLIYKFTEYLNPEDTKKISTGLLLSIAYGASAGGIATLIGTPPNLAFTKIYALNFPDAPEISFSQWFVFALPVSFVMLIAVWLILYFKFKPSHTGDIKENSIFKDQYKQLGKTTYEEKVVFTAFLVLAFLWIFRNGFNFGINIPGWASLFKHPEYLNDGTVAIFVSSVLFLIPSKSEKGKRILDNKVFAKLPWHIILLFGGGFALAKAFKVSGLTEYLGQQLTVLEGINPFLIIFIVALFMSFLTELTSNTASTQMILPILASLSLSLKLNPL
ncbi:MAG: SLC13/DASS family transporter, partial [Chlorobi bacterium]|nr:SLC13/DASS family transporter [Chlorobiota bacterium]